MSTTDTPADRAETIAIEDQAAWEQWLSEFNWPFAFIIDGRGTPWLLWWAEDGEPYATRAPDEDDLVDGHLVQPSPVSAVDGLDFPLVVVEVTR